MEDVRINRKKRFNTKLHLLNSPPAFDQAIGRNAGRTAIHFATDGSGAVVFIQGQTAASAQCNLWTSTAADFTKTFTIEEYGDMVTQEFFANTIGDAGNLFIVEVYLDDQ